MSDERPNQTHPRGVSLTKQSFKDDCDINVVMRKYEKSGLLTHLNQNQGDYSNFIDAPDYHTAMLAIRAAEENFMTIPAQIRSRFHNDAGNFLEFAQNPDNLEEMREMGLAPMAPSEALPSDPEPTPPVPTEE